MKHESLSSKTRVSVVQPNVPAYRRDFFRRVAEHPNLEFTVYHSDDDLGVLTSNNARLPCERIVGGIFALPLGLFWQSGLSKITVRKSDVVVISGNPRFLSCFYLLFKSRIAGAHVVWWAHLWSSTSKTWRFKLRMAILKFSDFALFYTDREVELFRRSVSESIPCAALGNGVDLTDIARFRASYDAATRPKRFLFIGRVTQKSELSAAIRALADPRVAEAQLIVLGDGEVLVESQNLARDLGVSERVEWLEGTTVEREIAAAANRSLAFVYPGAVGLSLIHAMAYGLPAIVRSDVSWSGPEVAAFTHEETGVSFESETGATAIADAMVNVLDRHDKDLNAWSSEAKRVVEDGYNTVKMSERFLDVLVNEFGLTDPFDERPQKHSEDRS